MQCYSFLLTCKWRNATTNAVEITTLPIIHFYLNHKNYILTNCYFRNFLIAGKTYPITSYILVFKIEINEWDNPNLAMENAH